MGIPPAISGDSVRVPEERVQVWRKTEVLVVGGGAAGIAAAVSAGRLGADVTLLEGCGHLGGLATGGLVILLLTLDDGDGHQVVQGICQEVVDRLESRGAAVFPPENERYRSDPKLVDYWAAYGLRWGKGPHTVRYSVNFDPEELIFVSNDLVTEAKVKLLLHTQAVRTIHEGRRIRGVVVQGRAKRGAILADVVIDTTGDGDVFALAGNQFELQKVVPWLWFRLGNVGKEAVSVEGPLKVFRTSRPGEALVVPWGGAFALTRAVDATEVEDLTWAEVACRKKIYEVIQTKLKELPGFENAYISHVATQLDITESRRLIGRRVLRQGDVNAHFDDSVGCTGNWSKYRQFYELPYPCLLSQDFDNLLVAGRCISADHVVHHSTKEIPACMVTGEAVGTAAALAVKSGVLPAALDTNVLRGQLARQNVRLGGPAEWKEKADVL
jgi:glycine/D-amino acid oxidase-like deaminating enzyme